MENKKFIEIFVFYFLLVEIATNYYYISLEFLDVDDCIKKINIKNGITFFEYAYNESYLCDYSNQAHYPKFFTKYYNYQLGEEIDFEFEDRVHIDAFMDITVYFNEYIIKTSDQKFWECSLCKTWNGNYFYGNVNNKGDYINFLSKREEYGYNYDNNSPFPFKCNFIINGFKDVYEYNFEIDNNFYSLNDNKTFYLRVYYKNTEFELINFNSSENIYITNNRDLPIDIDYFFFKINQLDTTGGAVSGLGFNGAILPKMEKDYEFKLKDSRGLRYSLTTNEINNKNAVVKLTLTAYSHPEYPNESKEHSHQISKQTEFTFII